MDFNMKQWREKQQESEEEEQQRPYAKIPRQHLTLQSFHHHQFQEAAALPLFVPSEPHDNKITTTIHCSSYSDGSSTPTLLSISSPRFPSNFSYCSLFLTSDAPAKKKEKGSMLSFYL